MLSDHNRGTDCPRTDLQERLCVIPYYSQMSFLATTLELTSPSLATFFPPHHARSPLTPCTGPAPAAKTSSAHWHQRIDVQCKLCRWAELINRLLYALTWTSLGLTSGRWKLLAQRKQHVIYKEKEWSAQKKKRKSLNRQQPTYLLEGDRQMKWHEVAWQWYHSDP